MRRICRRTSLIFFIVIFIPFCRPHFVSLILRQLSQFLRPSNDRASQEAQGGLLFGCIIWWSNFRNALMKDPWAGCMLNSFSFMPSFGGRTWSKVGLGTEMIAWMWIGTRKRTRMTILSMVATFFTSTSKNFLYPKIWIRAEYIRIYDAVKTHYEKPWILNNVPPAAVVTGQPRIGESCYPFIWRVVSIFVLWMKGERFTSMTRWQAASHGMRLAKVFCFLKRTSIFFLNTNFNLGAPLGLWWYRFCSRGGFHPILSRMVPTTLWYFAPLAVVPLEQVCPWPGRK